MPRASRIHHGLLAGRAGQARRKSSPDRNRQAQGATPAQIALAWLLAQPDIIAIPKAEILSTSIENHHAAGIELTAADLTDLDHVFPKPKKRKPLEML